MTEVEKKARKGGGAKLSRSETVTVRLDPKLRYLAELASRKQRRTLSSYIEWAIEEALKAVSIQESSNEDLSIADMARQLWDVDEADRFAKLALRFPDLLTHEEQKRWKLIRENGSIWRWHYEDESWTWAVAEKSLLWDQLREHWGIFCAVARDEEPASKLPTWNKPSKQRSQVATLDDSEIQF